MQRQWVPRGGGALFKSADGGHTWTLTDLVTQAINAIEFDPVDPSHIFAGVDFDTDGFVSKVDSTGSSLIYSTYLGTRSQDLIAAIGVDGVSNAYVTGTTFSDRFPIKDSNGFRKPSGLFDSTIFATMLNLNGSALNFSTYAGPLDTGTGSGIAVSPSGKFCVAGTTGKFLAIPFAAPEPMGPYGFETFVMRFASVPRISSVAISGKNLVVTGEGFDVRSFIAVNNFAQPTRYDDSRPGTSLIGKKSARSIAIGQQVSVVVANSEGVGSVPFIFTRTP